MERFKKFLVFCFETPEHAKVSLIVIVLVAIVIYPPMLSWVVLRFLNALGPLLGPLVIILLLYFGYKKLFGGFFPKPKKK